MLEKINKLLKWNLSQAFLKALTKAQNLHCRTTIFQERLLMTASALKHDHNIIKIKSVKSLKLFWQEVGWIEITIHYYYIIYGKRIPSFPMHRKKFSMLFLFNFLSQQIQIFFYVSFCEINCIKIQTLSLVLNLSILAEILCVLFTLMSSFTSDWKKSSR